MCTSTSNYWVPATHQAVNYLDRECREPAKLVLKKHSVVRLTINTGPLTQGQICIVAELPSPSDTSILVYVLPEIDSIATPNSFSQQLFLNWPTTRVYKSNGFIYKMKGSSVRRILFALTKYVVLTCHKLMGDTFPKLATQVSIQQRKYVLWMASLLYVIVICVRELKNIIFVGEK